MGFADKSKLAWQTSKVEAQLLVQRLATTQARWGLKLVANECGKHAVTLRVVFNEPVLKNPCQRALELVQEIERLEFGIEAKVRELRSIPAGSDAPLRAQLNSDIRALRSNHQAETKRLAEARAALGRLILFIEPADGRFAEFYRRRNQIQLQIRQGELKLHELQRRRKELVHELGFDIRPVWVVCAAIVAALVIAVVIWPGASASGPVNRRTLVFIVPGTFGNTDAWPNVFPGKATFGSELRLAGGPGTEIYPFLWDGANDHQSRESAAVHLAELIDSKASSFDRICLVGHSHGGNIALRAAGLCRTKIDSVVCLATPHVYLVTRGADGRALWLPVYCSPRTLQQTASIVSIIANGDDVPATVANWDLGLDQNGAISMTQAWQEALSFPRLGDDTLIGHLFGSTNVQSGGFLNLTKENIEIVSKVAGGEAQHSAIHSRRMGCVVGELIRDGCSKDRLDYVRTLVQPEESGDQGEPINSEEWNSSPAQRSTTFQPVGWRLEQISIHLNSVRADLYVKVTDTGGKRLSETPHLKQAVDATWSTDLIFFPDQTDILGVYSGYDSLGRYSITASPQPPTSLPVDPSRGIHWTADLQWVPVHY